MGEQRNLTKENVNELTGHLEKMQQKNPDLEFNFFEQKAKEYLQPDAEDTISVVKEIRERVVNLENKLDRIFGGCVLIDGEFKDIGIGKKIS